jgi:two-component system, chemotaxis family, protein-glutamate methylesterase/glutaminase
MNKKIKVLIVDDSAVARQALAEILSSDHGIEVMATASDPYIAADKIRRGIPDVIILDVNMPRMDGITFLRELMTQHPIPVVICSALTDPGSEMALKALKYGAVDIISKPKMGTRQFLEESKIRICDAVKGAAMARVKQTNESHRQAVPRLSAYEILEKSRTGNRVKATEKIVVVGASTGGTEALSTFLQAMPSDAPGIVIVQHMPEHFTEAFAKRLDSICTLSVKEAEHGDAVLRGRALIAQGNRHLLLKRNGIRYYVEMEDGPMVSRHRPSVDVLFCSAAKYAGENAIGVIMTGMGEDGAAGMREMKEAGASTFAQDEESCVVFGMPKKAIELNGVDHILPLHAIPAAIIAESNG